jgi:hypothetical protein
VGKYRLYFKVTWVILQFMTFNACDNLALGFHKGQIVRCLSMSIIAHPLILDSRAHDGRKVCWRVCQEAWSTPCAERRRGGVQDVPAHCAQPFIRHACDRRHVPHTQISAKRCRSCTTLSPEVAVVSKKSTAQKKHFLVGSNLQIHKSEMRVRRTYL